ncbi:coiled-coil domain-containing protein 190 [Discoglossus pictus]
MQRSRILAINADKQWEAERRGAKRDNIRLSHGLKEIEAAQMYHVNSMTKEQKRIQKDLERIRQANQKKSTNSRGVHQDYKASTHPTGSGGRRQGAHPDVGSESSAKGAAMASSSALQMRINDFMDGIINMKGSKESAQNPPSESSPSDASLADGAKNLSISGEEDNSQAETAGLVMDSGEKGQGEISPQSLSRRRSSLMKETPPLDPDMYLPNGQLRKMYTMPDFNDAMEQARKARYIRHRGQVEWERELTIEEIFQKDTKAEADTNTKKDGAGANKH